MRSASMSTRTGSENDFPDDGAEFFGPGTGRRSTDTSRADSVLIAASPPSSFCGAQSSAASSMTA